MVRPRLTDAEFFFKTDLKQKLVDRLPRLETVLFQQQLGTLKDKLIALSNLQAKLQNKSAQTKRKQNVRVYCQNVI